MSLKYDNVGAVDSNVVHNNYTHGGPGYNSQSGNRGDGAYVGYGGSREPSLGGTSFTTSVQLFVTGI